MLALGFITCGKKRSLALVFIIIILFLFLKFLSFLAGLFHVVEEINNFFGGILDDVDQIGFLESAINDNFGYFRPEFFIFLACLGKISDIIP